MLTSLVATIVAFAAPARADVCKTQGSKDAKELVLNLKNDKITDGLYVSFQLGLMPAEFPESDIRANAAPCARGTIPLGHATFELRGENEDSPPRWASTPNGKIIVFLALMPKPEPALAWQQKTRPSGSVNVSFGDGEWMHALVLTGGDEKRLVFAFFDQLPDDERLKSMMQQIFAGKARWLVGYDVKTRGVTVNSN